MGKIPLTNAELIKALLLKKVKNEFDEKAQFELASEWDFIEYSLRNEEFWYFLNSKDDKATRIEFIFELMVNDKDFVKDLSIENLNKSIDNYYTFHVFNLAMNTNSKNRKEIWDEVKKYFRILNEWFENRELFHKIGFLLAVGGENISLLINESKLKNKDIFYLVLDKKIKKIFENINVDELAYGDKKVKTLLLLFNIQTLLDNKKSNTRFQFDRFKNENWDIEHIRSQTDKYPVKKEKEKWIEDLRSFDNVSIKTKEEILLMKDDEFIIYYKEIEKKLEGTEVSDDFDKDSIGNLALLDATTNRSYGNAFFSIKRKSILENDMNGIFIPICTRNVFMKYYTNKPENIMQWQEKDSRDYLNAIKEMLNKYRGIK